MTARGADGAFASLARRYESALRFGSKGIEDLGTLLDVFRTVPVVAELVERHSRVRQTMEGVAAPVAVDGIRAGRVRG